MINNQEMDFLRKHWCDIGGLFSLVVFIYVFINHNELTNGTSEEKKFVEFLKGAFRG